MLSGFTKTNLLNISLDVEQLSNNEIESKKEEDFITVERMDPRTAKDLADAEKIYVKCREQKLISKEIEDEFTRIARLLEVDEHSKQMNYRKEIPPLYNRLRKEGRTIEESIALVYRLGGRWVSKKYIQSLLPKEAQDPMHSASAKAGVRKAKEPKAIILHKTWWFAEKIQAAWNEGRDPTIYVVDGQSIVNVV